jgi:Bacterial PH domain
MSARTVSARSGASVATGEREVLRLAPPVILWWGWIVFVGLNIADDVVQGLSSARFGAVISAILLLGTGLTYTLALRPKVIVDGFGVTVVNPFRTHRVPWRLIQAVDTGEWMRVHYAAQGPERDAGPERRDAKRLSCWAMYISAGGRRKLARGPRARRPMFGVPRAARWLDAEASSAQSSRLPDEARRLASMPVARAMAIRLDARATRERARKPRPGDAAAETTARLSWLPIVAATVPAIILVVVAILA